MSNPENPVNPAEFPTSRREALPSPHHRPHARRPGQQQRQRRRLRHRARRDPLPRHVLVSEAIERERHIIIHLMSAHP